MSSWLVAAVQIARRHALLLAAGELINAATAGFPLPLAPPPLRRLSDSPWVSRALHDPAYQLACDGLRERGVIRVTDHAAYEGVDHASGRVSRLVMARLETSDSSGVIVWSSAAGRQPVVLAQLRDFSAVAYGGVFVTGSDLSRLLPSLETSPDVAAN